MRDTLAFPVIFLDIHGVLLLKDGSAPEEAREALRSIVKDTSAQIIVTSTLRCGRSAESLRAMLLSLAGRRVARRVIGKLSDADIPRGELIAAWRETNNHTGPYVVIDDHNVDAEYKIRVDGSVGLTYQDALAAEKIIFNQT